MYLCETASFVRVVKGLLPAEGELEAPTTAFPFLKLFRRYSTNRVSLPQHLADGNHEKEETFVNNNTVQKAEEEEEEEKVNLKEQDELSWFPELQELEKTLDPSRDGEQLTQQQEEEEEEAVSLKEQNELSLFLELGELVKRQEEELKQSGDGEHIKQKEEEEERACRKEQGELSSFLELMELVKRQEEMLKQPNDGEQIKEKEKYEKNMEEEEEKEEEEEGVNLNEQDGLSLFLELQELVKRQEAMLKTPKDEEQIKEEKDNNIEEEEEEEGGSPKEQDELTLFLELQEMVKAQEQALEQLKGVEVTKQKSRKRVTFSLDNVDFPVKERELYNGREYFKCRRRLLTLRPELGREELAAPPRRPSRIPVPRPARTASARNPVQPPLHEQVHTLITTPPRRPSRIPVPRPARTTSARNPTQPPLHNPLHTLRTINNRPRPAFPSPDTHTPTPRPQTKTNTPPSTLPSPPTPSALSEE
ncbi:golgin subfamily A member 6-like protein 22 [Eriocheir sinensis]|uniref:golgin subfamily A member 6-like protein 22 n=1 Tax=Eriocheir sinensis TaxID=95602 RepID=UPI0021C69FB6|nr:golgin subfamily A member 6-like protein 22 [Eriocheir sinensis]